MILFDLQIQRLESELQCAGERRFGDDACQIDTQVYDSLCDLGTDTADDAFGAHQPCGAHRLDEVLGNQRVDCRDAGDIQDGDAASGSHDLVQQRFHDHLGAATVEGTDDGQREDTIPYADDRGRYLGHLIGLTQDHLFAALNIGLKAVDGEMVHDPAELETF